MNRRSLFGALALSPLMAVEAFTKEKPTGKPLSNAVNMTLLGAKMMRLSEGSFYLNVPQTDPNKEVSMAVGDDGNLWLKRKDGNWKRVVTE